MVIWCFHELCAEHKFYNAQSCPNVGGQVLLETSSGKYKKMQDLNAYTHYSLELINVPNDNGDMLIFPLCTLELMKVPNDNDDM